MDVLWVSNHGGRQIDHGQGSLDVLPEVVQVAKGKAKIIVDGGVQRGSDILKAVALGADAVALGRLQGWGLAAGGQAGVVRMLEILEDEMVCAMALAGLTSLSQLTPKYVCKADRGHDAARDERLGQHAGRPHSVGQKTVHRFDRTGAWRRIPRYLPAPRRTLAGARASRPPSTSGEAHLPPAV